jgi:hypothetical protein
LVGDEGRESSSGSLGVPLLGVDSALARPAFAFARFAIQLGCAFVAELGLGDSARVSALSIQLDFVGLKRFEGLLGGDVADSSAFTVYDVRDATDLLRL